MVIIQKFVKCLRQELDWLSTRQRVGEHQYSEGHSGRSQEGDSISKGLKESESIQVPSVQKEYHPGLTEVFPF